MSNKKLLKSTLKLERLSIHHRPASLFRKRLFAISLIKMCGFCFHLPVQERLSHRGSAGNDKWIVHPDEQPHDGMIEILPDPFEETGTSTSNAFHIVGFNFWKTWVFFFMRVLNIIIIISITEYHFLQGRRWIQTFLASTYDMSFGKVHVLVGVKLVSNVKELMCQF